MPADRCPIGREQVDEKAARINGGFTLVVLVAAVMLQMPWLLGYLVIDFALKVFAGFNYSPNCRAARWVADELALAPQMTDSAPKRFAAAVGLLMSVAALAAFYLAGSWWTFVGIVAALFVFAALESLAGFCMGCYIYGLLPASVARTFARLGV